MRIPVYIFSGGISGLVTFYLLPKLVELLKDKNIVAVNYRGRPVTTGGGLVFLFACVAGALPFLFSAGGLDYFMYLVVIFSCTFAGFIDDVTGDRSARGIKGHIKLILRGKISTGGIKAGLGIFTGFVISVVCCNGAVDLFLNVLLFALSVNFINLLDLRPGRAIKAFIIVIFIFSAIYGFTHFWILFPLIVSIVFYISGELEESYMLGDTGSSLIGGLLGFYAFKVTSPGIKVIFVIFLIAVHLIAEFYSISGLIESVPVLDFIDRIGRMTGGVTDGDGVQEGYCRKDTQRK